MLLAWALSLLGCSGTPAEPAPPPPPPIVEEHRLALGDPTCAVDDQRQVICWGWLPGTPMSRISPPTRVPELDGTIEIASAGHGVCARNTEGEVRCWGEPLGESRRSARPTEIPGLRGSTSIAIADQAVCGIVSEQVRCTLGYNREPQDLGIDRALTVEGVRDAICARRRDAPITCFRPSYEGTVRFALPGSEGAEISFDGRNYPCAFRDGTLRCVSEWPRGPELGQVPEGQPIAIGDAVAPITMTAPELVPGVVRAMAADSTSCRLSSGGELRCRATGSGNLESLPATLSGVTSFALDGSEACARQRDGKVSCWGRNDRGQTGLRPSDPATPTRVRDLPPATAIATLPGLACALDREGALWCWQDRIGWTRPRRVEGVPPLARLADGYAGGLCGAARDGGAVTCLCDRELRVVPMTGLDGSLELHGGWVSAIARGADGTVRSAGPCSGRYGYRPDPDEPEPPDEGPAFEEHPGLTGTQGIGAGWAAACVLGTDRTVRCSHEWRARGAAARRAQWIALRDVSRFWGGFADGCGVVGDREVVCFDMARAPGPGHRPDRTVAEIPTDVAGMTITRHGTCFWRDTGPIRCGELGESRELPAVTNVRAAAVSDISCALTADGSVWCWGPYPRGDGAPTVIAEPHAVVFPG